MEGGPSPLSPLYWYVNLAKSGAAHEPDAAKAGGHAPAHRGRHHASARQAEGRSELPGHEVDPRLANAMARPRISKARLAPPHVPPSGRKPVELPSLNLKALAPPPVKLAKMPLPTQAPETAIRNAARADVSRASSERTSTARTSSARSHHYRIAPFHLQHHRRRSEKTPPQKNGGEVAAPHARSKSPVRPWTPSIAGGSPPPRSESPSPGPAREGQDPVGAAAANSGAATERAPANKRGTAQEAVLKKKPSTSRQATPWVDIVGRRSHLDLQGGLRFPSRGGPVRGKGRPAGKPGPAESYYVSMLEKLPRDAKLLNDYACLLHEEGRFREASKNFRAALTEDPCNPNIFNAFALLLWEQNRHSKAQDMLKRALLCDPHFVPALLNTAICSLHLGKNQTAIQFFCRVLELKPELPAALLGCAIAMEDLGNSTLKEIEFLYKRVLSEEPSNFDALVAYGRFLKSKRYKGKQAEKLYSEALRIQPQDINLLCSYGVLLMEQCKEPDAKVFEKAAQFFKTALELDHANFEATYNFAVLLMRWERAFGEHPLIQRSSPQSPPAHDYAHRLMQEQSEKLKVKSPLSSITGSSEGRKSMAEHLYRQALALKPGDEDVLCSYAIFLSQVPVFGEASISEAERIFSRILHGKFSSSSQSLAGVYYCHLLRTHREHGEEKATAIERARGNWLWIPPQTEGRLDTEAHLPPPAPPPSSNMASSRTHSISSPSRTHSMSSPSQRDDSLSFCVESVRALPSSDFVEPEKGRMQEEREGRRGNDRGKAAAGGQEHHYIVSLSAMRQAS